MIPRIKVSYRFKDLLAAITVKENSSYHRSALINELKSVLGGANILLCASGRGALYTLLKCLPQRRILVPAYTCKAVIEAALLAEKELIFGELDVDSFNMSVDASKTKLDSDTILIATHQFGIPCDVKAMINYARLAGAFVIEDAAASLGSRVDGQITGSFGDAAFYSFDTTKLANVPIKGGALSIKDQALYERCAAFQSKNAFPMINQRKIKYLLLGLALLMLEKPMLYRCFHNLKFHWRGRYTDDSNVMRPCLGPFYIDQFSEWQAVILLPQIRDLERKVSTRRRIYSLYLEKLSKVTSFILPPSDSGNEWAPIRFPIRVLGSKHELYRKAAKMGVDFAFSFSFIAAPNEYKLSHDLASSILDLPFYERLTLLELEKVVEVLCEIDGHATN